MCVCVCVCFQIVNVEAAEGEGRKAQKCVLSVHYGANCCNKDSRWKSRVRRLLVQFRAAVLEQTHLTHFNVIGYVVFTVL